MFKKTPRVRGETPYRTSSFLTIRARKDLSNGSHKKNDFSLSDCPYPPHSILLYVKFTHAGIKRSKKARNQRKSARLVCERPKEKLLNWRSLDYYTPSTNRVPFRDVFWISKWLTGVSLRVNIAQVFREPPSLLPLIATGPITSVINRGYIITDIESIPHRWAPKRSLGGYLKRSLAFRLSLPTP